VLTALEQRGDGRELDQLVVALLEDWLAAEQEAGQAAPAQAGTGAQGYLWKELFLPNGTELHAATGWHGEVRRGRLLCEGRPTTPNRLADGTGGRASHNAWKAISIKRPGDAGFRRAWRLRREAQGKPPPRLTERPAVPARTPERPAVPPRAAEGTAVPLRTVERTAVSPRADGDGRRRAGAHQLERYSVRFDEPPGTRQRDFLDAEPVLIASRERRQCHARRCTDILLDD
jgi:hypothetical protein